MQEYIDIKGTENTDELVAYAHALATKYGEASGALACEMYDSVAEMSGANVPAAQMAQTATYSETAKAIYGTMLNQNNPVPQTVGRLVKQVAADTTLQNGLRDGAKFAWIPHGDTCAFCLMLASRGWQRVSKRALRNGHAEHIHPNCDCEYAISFDANPQVGGYDPDYYRRIYDGAEGDNWRQKINYLRREQYAASKAGNIKTEWDGDKLSKALKSDYNDFKKMVNVAANKKFYELFSESGTYTRDGRGYYTVGGNSIHFGLSAREGMNKYSTLAHESGHMFDHLIGRSDKLTFSEVDLINKKCVIGSGYNLTLKPCPSSSDEFLTALRTDMKALRPQIADRSIVKVLLENERTKNASSGLQDALDGFFSTQDKRILPWGHGDRYYNREYNRRFVAFGNEKKLKSVFQELGFDASNQTKTKRLSRVYETASEAWANMSSAVTCGGEELEFMKKYLPETYNAYMKIVEVV